MREEAKWLLYGQVVFRKFNFLEEKDMRKLLILVSAVAFIVAFALSATAGEETKPITLKFSSYSMKGLWELADVAWMNAIEKESGGRIKFEKYPYQQLMKAKAQLDGIRTGIADVGKISTPYYRGRFTMSEIGFLPFLWKSGVEGAIVLNELYDKYLYKEFEANGVKALIFEGSGGYAEASTVPIRSVEDLKGLTCRLGGILDGYVLEKLGAVSQNIASPDMFSALQTGLLDVASYSYTGIEARKLYEVAPHIIEWPWGGLSHAIFPTIIGLKTWNKLPKDLQDVITKVSKSKHWVAEGYDTLDEKAKEKLHAMPGVKFMQIAEADKDYCLGLADQAAQMWVEKYADKGPTKEIYGYLMSFLKEKGLR